MLQRSGYLEEYVAFWHDQTEVDRIWVSLYSPQIGEQSAEKLDKADRVNAAHQLTRLCRSYPKLLMTPSMAQAMLSPPDNPEKCLFARMSTNYTADLRTRVEPCIFGGTPDCSQCGCAVTIGAGHLQEYRLFGPLKAGHLVRGSIAIGSARSRLRRKSVFPSRWQRVTESPDPLIQIGTR